MNTLTAAEAAAQLRVTPQAVRAWCRAGALVATRAGREWRIKPEDLETFQRRGVPTVGTLQSATA